ncbi:MAG TPA: riboflavin synthase [Gemmatimonadaceae bacterium]|nr:riboflavin synthase [Gemmatimonadaceae bacterium]
MFTGIIEEVGQVVGLDDTNDFRTLSVRGGQLLNGVTAGASIAVNGVCLTVRTLQGNTFTADLSRETLDRTSLKSVNSGTKVNLELPMRADGRFGGHIVQGHVDCVGTIRSFTREGDSWNLQVELSPDALRYVVEKGSIAIDGISLTVAAIKSSVVEVAIIPHTFENTNLRHAKAGDTVNIEYDVIAKYVERMLHRDTA